MYTFFSTSLSGTSNLIENMLKQKLKNVSIIASLDGLVVYSSESKPEEVKQLRGLNNSFLLIKLMKTNQNSVERLIKQAIGEPKILQQMVQSISPKQYTFRIVTSEENHMVSIPQTLLSQLEEKLSHRSQLKPNRRNPQNEFWFITRSEGYNLIGLRLTKNQSEPVLQKGELSPEVAHLLCYLSEPNINDVVLDPFAGYGAIPIERTNSKSRQIIAIEKDPALVEIMQSKIQKLNKKITVQSGDAINLPQIESQSISKIITDPPWGEYDKNINISDLYTQMFKEFERVLKSEGIIILVSSQKQTILNLLSQARNLKLLESYDILLSGKKAAIYKIKKQ